MLACGQDLTKDSLQNGWKILWPFEEEQIEKNPAKNKMEENILDVITLLLKLYQILETAKIIKKDIGQKEI